MKLTVVGATGSMSGPKGAASCYLVQAEGFDPELGKNRTWSFVMDLGPGAFGQLWNYVDPRHLDALLISHGHADHLADIISLQVFLRWHPDGLTRKLPVYGPAEISSRVGQIEGYLTESDGYPEFDFRIISETSSFRVGPMTITAFRGFHPIESYGFRVEGPSELDDTKVVTIAYTGDTDSCEQMTQMADGVNVLLAECGFTDQVETRGIHLSGTRAAELARDAGVNSMVFTHIQPWTDPRVPVAEAKRVLGWSPEVARAGATWEV